jgi:hypothetical protein
MALDVVAQSGCSGGTQFPYQQQSSEADRSASSNRMRMEGQWSRIEPFILAVFNKLPEKSRCVLFQRILTIV